MKNIWFVSQYEYINKDIFLYLINHFGPDYNIFIYKLPLYDIDTQSYPQNIHFIGLQWVPYAKYLSSKYIKPTRISKLFHSLDTINNFLNKKKLFLNYIQDEIRFIRIEFLQNKPDIIIVGSDAGIDLDLRILLSIGNSQKIPMIIIYRAEISDFSVKRSKHLLLCRLFRDIDPYSYLFMYLSVFFIYLCKFQFYADIPGFLARYSKIFVVSSNSKRVLVNAGIKENSVEVFNFNEKSQTEINHKKNKFFADNNISPDKKIVIYYTETLQLMPQYGIQYLLHLNESMIPIFHRLKEKNNIEIFVKPHPQDPKPNETDYFQTIGIFEEAGIPIIKNYSAAELIQFSDLSIAHFSFVLIESLLAGTKIFSINTANDVSNTFLKEDERLIFEIPSLELFEEKITSALYDDTTKHLLEENLIKVQNRYRENSKTLKEIAEYIIEVVHEEKII